MLYSRPALPLQRRAEHDIEGSHFMLDYTQLLISYGLPLLFPLVIGSMGTCVLLSAKKARFVGRLYLLLMLCNLMSSIRL